MRTYRRRSIGSASPTAPRAFNGQVVGSYAYGWATKDKDPMTTAHKMRIASVSKSVVAIATMVLYERGFLDLYSSIGDVWGVKAQNPQFPDHVINIWNILSHTSSIASYEDNVSTAYRDVYARLSYGYWSVEPGVMKSRCYNNYAFRVLGMTCELAANRTMDDILDLYLFDDMDISAAFASGDIEDPELLVTLYDGYAVSRSVYKQLQYHSPETPGENGSYFAGGLAISAEDLEKLAAMLGNDGVYNGTRYLDAETVALMEELMDTPLENGAYQGHPFMHVPELYGREQIYFQTGRGAGVFSSFSYDAATGDGVVVLTSGAKGYMNDIEIARICDDLNTLGYNILAEKYSANN